MRNKIKYVLFKLFFCFIWLFFIKGGETYDYYYFGEFDGVKIIHSKYLDLTKQTNEQKAVIKHIQILEYQKWEPYYKAKLKTLPLFVINFNFD